MAGFREGLSLPTESRACCGLAVGLTGFTFVDCAGKNIDRVAIGRGLGSRVLGHYQQALFVYYNILDTLVYTLHQVAISGLSKLQNEPEEFRRCLVDCIVYSLAFYVMPCFGLLAVTSQDVVVLLLGRAVDDGRPDSQCAGASRYPPTRLNEPRAGFMWPPGRRTGGCGMEWLRQVFR